MNRNVRAALHGYRQTHALNDLALWLISMDDPEDAAGMEARRTVTLTQIIERARAALPAHEEAP